MLVIMWVIAGMAADLFETYAVTSSCDNGLSSIFFPGDMSMMIYPLTIGGACILTSIIGTFFVKLGKSKNVMGALYKGFVVSAITSLIILYQSLISFWVLKILIT